MARPSPKCPEIENFLEDLFGTARVANIMRDTCVNPPSGCAGPAVEFRDELSKREFRISGLCQKCQDKIFGVEEPAV